MIGVSLTATASYLPDRVMDAAELAADFGVPEPIVIDKFGLRGKHIAAPGEHASDLAAEAGRRLLAEQQLDPATIDAVVYFGSTWKDYPVWQAAPRVAHLLGCDGAFALELDYVSCGGPIALRVARDLLAGEPELFSVLLVAGCRESGLIDPANPRTRFMLNFGDGAVAALLRRGEDGCPVLGSHAITDGSYSLHTKVPAGGSAEPASPTSIAAGRHRMDVVDPAGMKRGLDTDSLPNFLAVADVALRRSGAQRRDIDHLCAIHVKRSLHDALLDALGLDAKQATYLQDTGHMSGIDPVFGLDRAWRAGDVGPGDLVLLLAAGTGYTWAATVVQVGAP